MAEIATVETPVITPSAAGGSRSNSAPASAPSGTSVSHGTAGSALVAAAERMMKDEGAASSAATKPAAESAGDTAGTAAPSGTGTVPEQKPPTDPTKGGDPASARNPELEQRFQAVARSAQAKILNTLGLTNVSYEQLPQVAKEMRVAFDILRDLRKNPRDFYSRLGAELGGGESGAPGGDFKLPDGRLVAEDGKTRVYSQEQIIAEVVPALKKMITDELLNDGRFSKVVNYVDEETDRRQSEATARQRQQTIAQVLTEAREQPHFKEHEQEVLQLIAAWHEADPERVKSRGVAWAVNAAYNQVLNKKVYGEGYRNTVEAEIREGMKRKAAGGSSGPVGDAGRVDGSKKEIRNVTDLAEHMRRMEAAG